MNKKFVSNAVAALIGIASLILISSTISLMFEAIFSNDLADISNLSESMESLLSYIRNTAIAVVIFSAAAIATYVFTYFSNHKKVFAPFAAALSLVLSVICFAFIFDLRAIVIDKASESLYTVASAYFTELITIIVSALLLLTYFTIVAVKAFTEKDTQAVGENAEAAPLQTEANEEAKDKEDETNEKN